jgi:hypothetical protein
MPQKYYNTTEVAEVLHKTPDEVKQMLERRELHGYRDGADWKFKVEDIDKLAKDSAESTPAVAEDSFSIADEGDDVLLSEVALGQADPGLSGTVIGLSGVGKQPDKVNAVSDSDIVLGSVGDSSALPTPSAASVKPATKQEESGKFEDLELAIDDSGLLLDSSPTMATLPTGAGSSLDLGGGQSDDEAVLGGSSSGSGISLGGDSGISLVDPADSGFSLETPVNLEPAAGESLVLGEDDLLASGDSSAKTMLTKNDDFQLTPLEDAGAMDESESGSQVIALDADGDESATMVGIGAVGAGAAMMPMLDTDLGELPMPSMTGGLGGALPASSALGVQPGVMADGPALAQGVGGSVVYEFPYTGWQIAALSICLVLFVLCGIMTYDLLRSIWGGEQTQPIAINSAVMDWIGNQLHLFGK